MADRVRLPSGGGGLVRYFDEYRSKIELKPAHVIILIILVIILEIILHSTASSLLS